MALTNVTAAELRTYVRWPEGVPGDFLDRHLAGAARDVGHALFGVARDGDVPAGFEGDAAEAITALAAASAFPFIHTFTQDGAAAAVRSVQLTNNKPHFQGADDQGKNIARLKARAEALLSRIQTAMARDQAAGSFGTNDIFMGAI